jgi:ribonuclease HI
MQKKTLESLYQSLRKALPGQNLDEAFTKIKNEIDQFQDEVPQVVSRQFDIPQEIRGNSHAYALYSDGGCKGNPGPGAYGALVQNYLGEVLFEKSDFQAETTNNKMELMGVIEGLKELNFLLIERFEVPQDSEVYVFTDSKYVVEGMNSWMSSWKNRGWKKADGKEPENLDYWQILDSYRDRYKKLNFNWVKGHAGHPQNERCDELANILLKDMGF